MEIKGKSFNEYHRTYYHDKIKGNKKTCECGMIVDHVYRFTRHRLQKKHLKNLEKIESENLENKNIENLENTF